MQQPLHKKPSTVHPTRIGEAAAPFWKTSFHRPLGAAKAVGVVIPELNKKLTGMSFRVPTSDVSVVEPDGGTQQGSQLQRNLRSDEGSRRRPDERCSRVYEDKVVATDFRGESCTSTFDADAGIALDGTFLKVVAWYDNEWGYSCKVLEMIRVMTK